MQTFLPYRDFRKSAEALDQRRLQKQLVECQQLLNAITNPDAKGWRNHPAAIMWRGHENALADYARACHAEWTRRGYGPAHKSMDWISTRFPSQASVSDPAWLGDEAFHASHRANLLRKDPAFYSQHGWDEDPTMEYVWPAD